MTIPLDVGLPASLVSRSDLNQEIKQFAVAISAVDRLSIFRSHFVVDAFNKLESLRTSAPSLIP